MHLRAFRSSDTDSLPDLHRNAYDEDETAVPDDFFDDLKDVEAGFAGGAFIVAEEDGGIVGMGGLLPSGEIVRMRVDPRYQRRGVATRILGALEAEAAKLHVSELHLHTLETQRKAQALYEKYGFRESARGEVHGNPVVQYRKAVTNLE